MADYGKLVRKAFDAAKGIRAYHGSPHDFERFDISKIGTGEGAQAYGHGLYFAEHEPVALSYKQSTTDLKDWPITGGKEGWRVPSWAAKTAMASSHGLDQVAREFAMRARNMRIEGHWNAGGIQEIADALAAVKAGKAELKKPGTMYEVNIRAEPQQFLDWDKPLAQHSPEVQSALRSALPSTAGYIESGAAPRHLRGVDTPEGTARLAGADIPGIRYLDQGSRGGGTGTSNYVLFRDDIIDILRKYGIAAPAAGVVADQARYMPDQR